MLPGLWPGWASTLVATKSSGMIEARSMASFMVWIMCLRTRAMHGLAMAHQRVLSEQSRLGVVHTHGGYMRQWSGARRDKQQGPSEEHVDGDCLTYCRDQGKRVAADQRGGKTPRCSVLLAPTAIDFRLICHQNANNNNSTCGVRDALSLKYECSQGVGHSLERLLRLLLGESHGHRTLSLGELHSARSREHLDGREIDR